MGSNDQTGGEPTMRYRLLGKSGLRVSELCLGTMTFGDERDEGWGASRDEAQRIFEAFVEHGGNFFDTANNYVGGMSERYLGELVASERDRFVVATKYTAGTRPGDPNAVGNHRKNLVQSLDASLKRLRTDYIDLYWVHVWDSVTPLDELMRALDDAVRAGKVLYLGASDTPAWVVSRANILAELRGLTPFSAIQVEYSLIQRTVERDLLPMASALGLAVLTWASLGRGLLTGKYSRGDLRLDERRRLSPDDGRRDQRSLSIAKAVDEVADELGVPSSQVAVAWLRQQHGLVVPLVGARTAGQLRETLGSLSLELEDSHLQRLDEVSRISLGFPHDFIAGLRARYIAGMGSGSIEEPLRLLV
jgi:aryl-alcohol dehydrogenase-like predicted oxidoreductase